MSNIFGVQPPNPSQEIEPIGQLQPRGQADGPTSVSDTVEISTAAKLAAKVQSEPLVRTELVDRVKAEIQAGRYETPERIDATVEALLGELFPEL
jgi:anti-sigma28 factor (negative regulator of flagellin synthesis)